MSNQSTLTFYFAGQKLPLGKYTLNNRYKFTTELITYFGGHEIPANTEVEFWETTHFGWMKWKDQDGNFRLAKE